MSEQIPSELVFNGINGRTGCYLLSLEPAELNEIAAGFGLGGNQKERLEYNAAEKGDTSYAVRVGLDHNDLSQVGWGIILPAQKDERQIAALTDHLGELVSWRIAEAGQDRVKVYAAGDGYLPGETADEFMKRHGGSPGVYDPDTNQIPYYLLIVGSPEEIPFPFQYELDVTYLVGRVDFGDDLAKYAQYAHSVVSAERDGGLRLARQAAFFGTSHTGDPATNQSAEDLVAPLAKALARDYAQQGWQIDLIPPDRSRWSQLEALLGRGDAPALLFTATHGIGFDAGDDLQEAQQGALLCQDWEAYGQPLLRDHYLAAQDITDDFRLHGLVAFHFACFGVGTPVRDSFPRLSHKIPPMIARRSFTAALPQRLLSHPKGGALAVIGHIDRAWTYSFKWGENRQQTATFQDTLARLMLRERVGVALDSFNLRYSQIAVRLSERLNIAEARPLSVVELGGLWTSNNDARGYALLGDPAVRLPVAEKGQDVGTRQELAPVVLRATPAGPQSKPGGGASRQPGSGASQAVFGSAPSPQAGGPVTIQVTPQGYVTITVSPQPAPPSDQAEAAFDFPIRLGRRRQEGEEAAAAGPLDEAIEKLRQALQTIGTRIGEFAGDVTSLEVRTYVSDAIEDVDVQGGKLTGDARQRAVTVIKLDGDTEVIVPTYAGEIDQALWEIHSKAVDQAQAHRTAMLQAIGELVAGLIPTTT